MGVFSESYFTFSLSSLLKCNRAAFYARNHLLKGGPGIYGPHHPSRDSAGKCSHGKWNNKQVAEENEGNRERAEGCRSRRGLEALS